jgi:Protein of unknown function (DUF3800)
VRAKSRIGRLCPHANLTGREVFVAVHTFLDCSGQKSDHFVTLGAFAATDEVWFDFEQGWNQVLTTGFIPVPYMHMVEAVGLRDGSPFDKRLGWDKDKIFELIWKLVTFMHELDKEKFRIAWCEIDMDAWREMKNAGLPVPDEVTLCNRYCPGMVMPMFFKRFLEDNVPIEREYHFVFDRNERYYDPFRNQWLGALSEAESTNVYSQWQDIRSITEVQDMKDSPGIQAADMVAWSVNRENASSEGKPGFMLAHVMRQVIPHFAMVFDKNKLMESFGTKERAEETNSKAIEMDTANANMNRISKDNPEFFKKILEMERAKGNIRKNNRLKPSPLDRFPR